MTKKIHLLWTGGWDSTFRLLQVLLKESKTVQPYYVIDPARKSAGIELYTMHKIETEIISNFPSTKKRLLPNIYINRKHIKADDEITKAWIELNKQFHIGTQYEWLARYCKQLNVAQMEISLFSDQKTAGESEFRKAYSEFFKARNSNQKPELNEFTLQRFNILFKHLNSPIIQLTKPDMYAYATVNQWMDIMKMTSFCHRPSTHIKPCGVCRPCRLAWNDGMHWRMPFSARINRFIFDVKSKIKHDFLKL